MRSARAKTVSVGNSTLFLLALLLAACFASGCVGATGDSEASGSNLVASPGSINFGDVTTGKSVTKPVTVTNGGTADVSVESVTLSGPGFTASGLPTGLVLSPGATAALSLTFAPASAGKVTGSATIAEKGFPLAAVVTLSGNGVSSGTHSVTLNWSASTSSVSGYRAYRAANAGGPYTALNSSPISQLRYTDSTVQAGTTYYYVVTAVGSDSSESGYSNQASGAVPKP
jgi:ASPM-SPD-2-Hydin domain-containing protein